MSNARKAGKLRSGRDTTHMVAVWFRVEARVAIVEIDDPRVFCTFRVGSGTPIKSRILARNSVWK